MTIEEIQAELDKMTVALVEAGWQAPDAVLQFGGSVVPYLGLREDVCKPDGKREYLRNMPMDDLFAAAWAFINALPDPQMTILSTYSRKLADAIDYGHENNIPGKLVDPVRRAQKAVSDMLLPAPEAAS